MKKRTVIMYGLGLYQCGCGGLDDRLYLDRAEAEAAEPSLWDSIYEFDDPANEWSVCVEEVRLEEIAAIWYQGREFVVFRIPGTALDLPLHTELLEKIPKKSGDPEKNWKKVDDWSLKKILWNLKDELSITMYYYAQKHTGEPMTDLFINSQDAYEADQKAFDMRFEERKKNLELPYIWTYKEAVELQKTEELRFRGSKYFVFRVMDEDHVLYGHTELMERCPEQGKAFSKPYQKVTDFALRDTLLGLAKKQEEEKTDG